MEEFLHSDSKFWFAYICGILVWYYIRVVLLHGFFSTGHEERPPGVVFWMITLLAFSVPPGWKLSESISAYKEGQAAIERQSQEAYHAHLAAAQLRRKRDLVTKNRAESISLVHPSVVLKDNKTLERATITAFQDDGITFSTPGGVVRATWEELPDDWVEKYRMPSDDDKSQSQEERQLQLAKEQALKAKRALVAKNRTESINTVHDLIRLKNQKTLEHMMITAFLDDGISFASADGVVRVKWADLPDDWVEKYRDPVTADAAASKSAAGKADLETVMDSGRDVQITFIAESPYNPDATSLQGSIVDVRAFYKNGWRPTTKRIFLLNFAKITFEGKPMLTLRIFPAGSGLFFFDPQGRKVNSTAGTPLKIYTVNAEQALQRLQSAREPLADLEKMMAKEFY